MDIPVKFVAIGYRLTLIQLYLSEHDNKRRIEARQTLCNAEIIALHGLNSVSSRQATPGTFQIALVLLGWRLPR